MTTAAENHRRVAGTFTDRVRGVSGPEGWDAPLPGRRDGRPATSSATSWSGSRDFSPSGSGIRLPAGPSVADDPVGAWQTHCDAVQAVLDDPSTATKVLANRHLGEVPLPEAIDRFYTADVFMHTWDLARATGQDDTLDPEYCAELLEGMIPFEEAMRGSGSVRATRPGPRRRARARPDARVHRPRSHLAAHLTRSCADELRLPLRLVLSRPLRRHWLGRRGVL